MPDDNQPHPGSSWSDNAHPEETVTVVGPSPTDPDVVVYVGEGQVARTRATDVFYDQFTEVPDPAKAAFRWVDHSGFPLNVDDRVLFYPAGYTLTRSGTSPDGPQTATVVAFDDTGLAIQPQFGEEIILLATGATLRSNQLSTLSANTDPGDIDRHPVGTAVYVDYYSPYQGETTRRWRSDLPIPRVGDEIFVDRSGYRSKVEPLDDMETTTMDIDQGHYVVSSYQYTVDDEGLPGHLTIKAYLR